MALSEIYFSFKSAFNVTQLINISARERQGWGKKTEIISTYIYIYVPGAFASPVLPVVQKYINLFTSSWREHVKREGFESKIIWGFYFSIFVGNYAIFSVTQLCCRRSSHWMMVLRWRPFAVFLNFLPVLPSQQHKRFLNIPADESRKKICQHKELIRRPKKNCLYHLNYE